MNAIEFIKSLPSDISDGNWQDALISYRGTPNHTKVSDGYFRTKFNNSKRDLPLQPLPSDTVISIRPEREIKVESDVQEDPVKKEIILETEFFAKEDLESFTPQPISTGTYADNIIGQDLGFARSSVNVFVGGAGTGKTSTLVALAVEAIENREVEITALKNQYYAEGREWDEENPPLKPITANIVHGEMRKKEWMVECHEVPYFHKVGMIFLRQHRGSADYAEILRLALGSADIVIIDSFPVILSHMRISYPRKTANAILYEVIDLFTDTADTADNVINVINQVNKDGQYKGGTDLVHMVSSLAYFKIENRKRCLEFEKNRNGGATINQKLFFGRTEDKRLDFNVDAYETTYLCDEDSEQSVQELLESLSSKNNSVIEDLDFSTNATDDDDNN